MLDQLFTAAREVRHELMLLTNQLNESNKKLDNIEKLIASMIISAGTPVSLPGEADPNNNLDYKIFHPTNNIFNSIISKKESFTNLHFYDNDAYRLPSLVVAGWPTGRYCDKISRDVQLLLKFTDGFICINGFPKINGIRLFVNSLGLNDTVTYDPHDGSKTFYLNQNDIRFSNLSVSEQSKIIDSIQSALNDII